MNLSCPTPGFMLFDAICPSILQVSTEVKSDPVTTCDFDPSDSGNTRPCESPAEGSTDGSDTEDEAMEPLEEGIGAEGDMVVLVGRDDTEIQCSKAALFQKSGKLYSMIVSEAGKRDRIYLPLPYLEIQLLYDSLNHHGLPVNHWDTADLNELIRALDLYLFYDVYGWDTVVLENAIIDRLKTGYDGVEQVSRVDLADCRYVSKLRCIAEQANMERLVQCIDKQELPKYFCLYEHGERPRKWQKISHK